MTVVYKRDPYFEELLNAKKIGSIEAFNKVINSKLGLGKIPQFLQDGIIQILESRSALTIIDPCAGLGFLLEIVRQKTSAKKSIAFSDQESYQRSIFDNHDWSFGNPLELLDRLKENIDVAISILPLGLPTKNIKLVDNENKNFELRGPIEDLILAYTLLKLNDDGIGLFVIGAGFFLQTSRKGAIIRELSSFGCYVSAALELPKGSFSGHSVTTYLLIVKKKVQDRMFVAKLSNNLNTNKQIVSNYEKNIEGGSVDLGKYVQPLEFSGIDPLRLKEEFESITKNSRIPVLRLEDISKQINMGRYGEDFQFSEEENSIYVPTIGNSDIKESIEDLKLKNQNYVQILIDETKSKAHFVAKFLNSEIGKKSLESKKTGITIPKLNKQNLKDVKIIIPDSRLQKNILHVDSKITSQENTILSLQNELLELKNKLWNNPDIADEADQKIDDFSQRITKEIKEQTELSLEDWFENLPYPLSSILRAWQASSSDDYKTKYEHLLHFFEATAQFISIIFLSAYIKNDSLFEEHRNKLNEIFSKNNLSFERPTFATWKNINEYLGKQTRNMLKDDCEDKSKLCSDIFSDSSLELPKTICNMEVLKVLNQTNSLRNSWKGHGGIVGQDDAKLRNERLFHELLSLRMALGDWKNSTLVKAINCKARHGIFENMISKLMGSNSEFLKETIKLSTWLDVEKLYIIQKNQGGALELLPLIQFSSAPKSNKSACYFFNRIDSKSQTSRFVSYHYIDEPEINEESIETANTIKLLSMNLN